jgi:MraZ protein
MLVGTYDIAFDKAGRMTIPARCREAMGDTVCVTKALPPGECLWLFHADGFKEFIQRVFPVESLRPQDRNLKRVIMGEAYELKVDRAGRVLIPERLRAYAGLVGSGRVVGMDTYLEVWDEAKHDEWLDQAAQPEMEAAAEQTMAELMALQAGLMRRSET